MIRKSHDNNRPNEPDRLGWRISEWMRLTGTSRPTLWRQVKRGDLKLCQCGSSTRPAAIFSPASVHGGVAFHQPRR
jgi:hypothetical protein